MIIFGNERVRDLEDAIVKLEDAAVTLERRIASLEQEAKIYIGPKPNVLDSFTLYRYKNNDNYTTIKSAIVELMSHFNLAFKVNDMVERKITVTSTQPDPDIGVGP